MNAEDRLREFENWLAYPEWAKDCIISDAEFTPGLWDRVLILVGRPILVTTRTHTSAVAGRTEGMARWHVPGIRWPWSRPPLGFVEVEPPAHDDGED